MQLLYTILTAVAIAAPAKKDETESGTKSVFRSCGSSENFVLHSATFTPDIMKKGEPVVLTMTATLKMPLDRGITSKNTMKYGFFPVMDDSHDLCDDEGMVCPVPAGEWTHSKQFVVPGFALGGKYDGKFEFIDSEGEQVLCLEADMYFN